MREGDVSSDLVRSGVPMHCCGCESGHSVSLPLRLMRVISQVEPDILHFHSLPVLGALVARVSRTVSVYTLHLLPSNRMDRVAIAAYGKAIRGVISVGDDASLFDLCNKLFPTAQWRVIPNGVTIRISEAELPSTSTRSQLCSSCWAGQRRTSILPMPFVPLIWSGVGVCGRGCESSAVAANFGCYAMR